jgi:hypothetical protein
MLDVDEATPLVDYKGSSFGEIMVEMVPTMGGVRADVDEVEVRRGAIEKWSSATMTLTTIMTMNVNEFNATFSRLASLARRTLVKSLGRR